MMYSERTTCRICGSTDLEFLFTLGEQYVNNFVDPGKEKEGPKVPITLDLCKHCSLVQARYTAPPDILYSRFYWYRSGVTDTMREALRDITITAENLLELQAGDIALDIGSNDGTLLRSYNVPGLITVGVEPADNLVEEGSKGITSFIHDFWYASTFLSKIGKKAKVITAIGMFYDLDDPNQFISDVAAALDENGIFIAQLMCLRNTVDSRDVGNFAHEHLEFYSFASLQYLFEKHGLEIIDVEKNKINGGSYRLYARHIGAKVEPFNGAQRRIESIELEETNLDRAEFYVHFLAMLENNKKLVTRFVEGKTVWIYGASTKGNVILQYYGLDNTKIVGAAERSPEKWGKVTIGTGIPIFSEDFARAQNPPYFLVLPYAFIDEFVEREVAWRKRGGRFIVPLPEFKVI